LVDRPVTVGRDVAVGILGAISGRKDGNASRLFRLNRNEGVGEHVRPDLATGRSSGETAALELSRIRTERRKLVSSTGPAFQNLSFERSDSPAA
jgi:hypothetical protein